MSKPDMSAILFETYGTNKVASHTAEDQQKQAEVELFLGLCKSAGIDPKHLTDEQVEALWKEASKDMPAVVKDKEEDKKKKDEEEKKASATREWQEKRAAAEKVAEADALGRIMAHAYVDELQKIGSASKVAELPPQFMKNVPGKGEEKAEGKGEEKAESKKDEKEEEKKKESQARASALIAKLAGQNGASSTPSLDEQAAVHAVELLKSAGYDDQVAYARVNAIHTLGLSESTKIASAATAETALTVRALEYCEAAGFPVDWAKV